MSFNRTSSRVAIGLLVMLIASPTLGQGPLGMQLFAPADCSTYGGDIQPNEGYFFQFDGLYWAVSSPRTTLVGQPNSEQVWYGPTNDNVRDEYSTLTTGDFRDQFSAGNRFEFGRIEDRNGWLVSIYQLRSQSQFLGYSQADVLFDDPPQGARKQGLLAGPVPANPANYPTDPTLVEVARLPVTLYGITISNQVTTWGVEANYLHRAMTSHDGGTFEFFGGPRYLEFDDTFGFQAGADPGGTVVPSFLENSSWFTEADNHIVGPQVGMRWFKKAGRWTFSTEGRFMAGMNCQNIHQSVNLGPNLNPGGVQGSSGGVVGSQIYTPATMSPTSANTNAFAHVFTPLIELRLEGRYQITRALSFHAGWTGFWMDNIARANGMVDYTLPAMGIDMTSNKESVLINGLTLGFDINR